MAENFEVKYGLPSYVKFCKQCVMSNQRPTSSIEFKHTKNRKHQTLHFNEEGICDACVVAEEKEKIDWLKREKVLHCLLEKYRRNDGQFDCVVPGSGGKDSAHAAYLLKY